jgi:hypothetical protein
LDPIFKLQKDYSDTSGRRVFVDVSIGQANGPSQQLKASKAVTTRIVTAAAAKKGGKNNVLPRYFVSMQAKGMSQVGI